MQRGLCSFQWALWQSLLQYLTRPQREQLDRVGSWRSQWAQASASSLEVGFFFLGGMALGCEEKNGERGVWETPATPPPSFFLKMRLPLLFLLGLAALAVADDEMVKAEVAADGGAVVAGVAEEVAAAEIEKTAEAEALTLLDRELAEVESLIKLQQKKADILGSMRAHVAAGKK